MTGPAGRGKTALVRTVVGHDAVWIRGLASLRERSGATLSPAVPSVHGDLERDASRLLGDLGGRRLVIDDAHWADPYTLLVVELVSTATRPVATWRTGDPAAPGAAPAHWASFPLGRLAPGDARLSRCGRRPTSPKARSTTCSRWPTARPC